MSYVITKSGHEFRDVLLNISQDYRVYLEGSLLRIITASDNDEEFKNYLDECRNRDVETRRKRLNLTKQVQQQNEELIEANDKNCRLVDELEAALTQSKNSEENAQKAREQAERMKDTALKDLDILQKKTRYKLIGLIVKIALAVIVGVGVLTTILYIFALVSGHDSTIIETTWSNLFGILLTNSFSIIGTIMGVRYASKSDSEESY